MGSGTSWNERVFCLAEKQRSRDTFRIGERQFSICRHHRGSKQIKVCYVDEFLDVMEDLDLYEN